jgi:hypothetical protein
LRRDFVLNGFKNLKWATNFLENKKSFNPKLNFQNSSISNINKLDINNAVSSLNNEGIWVSPHLLSSEWIEEVKKKLSKLKVTSRKFLSDVQISENLYPKDIVYDFNSKDLEEIQELKNLIMDSSILEIVHKYLKCKPVFDFATAWWTFPSEKPDSDSAQLFHFDLDRLRWLKVFVYLSDVTPDNGPHCYINGSHHLIANIERHDGRYTDDEIKILLPNNHISVLTSPAGTLFIEDTIGFHKGTEVKSGSRCVFEAQFSVGHFGYPYAKSSLDNLF